MISKIAATIIASSLFLFSTMPVQAATGTPDILSSVSSKSVQLLTKAESAEARGEYFQTETFNDFSVNRTVQFSNVSLPLIEFTGISTITRTLIFQGPGFFVSR